MRAYGPSDAPSGDPQTGGGQVKVKRPRGTGGHADKALLTETPGLAPPTGSFPGMQRMLKPQGTHLFGPILELTHRILGSFS